MAKPVLAERIIKDLCDIALDEIRKHRPRTTKEIAAVLGYTSGGAARILYKLAERGAVVRESGVWRLPTKI